MFGHYPYVRFHGVVHMYARGFFLVFFEFFGKFCEFVVVEAGAEFAECFKRVVVLVVDSAQ